MRPLAPLLVLTAVVLATSCSSGSDDHQGIAVGTPSASPRLAPDDHGSAAATASPTAAATGAATPSPSPTQRATRSPRPLPTSTRSAPMAGGRYVFPVQGCKVSYGRSHHDYPATDIFAARGCAVVSPVTGTVDEVSTVDRWSSTTDRGADRGGLSFSVVGTDGVRYYGSHLTTVVVRPGQHVTAGQKVGTVGNTGSARGIATHLHFGISWPTRHGIWWVRRGEVYPWPYLDSWKAGGSRSPAAAVAAKRRQVGTVPPCPADC